MKDVVFEKCPKCKGQGKIRYRVWDSHSIIGHLIAYKRGEPLDETVFNVELLKILCPLCDGDGVYDWVRVMMRNDVLKDFEILTGNMDIYFAKCFPKWIPNPTHQTQWIRVYGMFRKPEKLIELSQRHYTNIKLNNKVLSMSADELHDITVKCFNYSHSLLAVDEDDLTGNKICEILESVGLSDFVPDKFAYPSSYDYPK